MRYFMETGEAYLVPRYQPSYLGEQAEQSSRPGVQKSVGNYGSCVSSCPEVPDSMEPPCRCEPTISTRASVFLLAPPLLSAGSRQCPDLERTPSLEVSHTSCTVGSTELIGSSRFSSCRNLGQTQHFDRN